MSRFVQEAAALEPITPAALLSLAESVVRAPRDVSELCDAAISIVRAAPGASDQPERPASL